MPSREYINQWAASARSKGFSDDEIRTEVLKRGWGTETAAAPQFPELGLETGTGATLRPPEAPVMQQRRMLEATDAPVLWTNKPGEEAAPFSQRAITDVIPAGLETMYGGLKAGAGMAIEQMSGAGGGHVPQAGVELGGKIALSGEEILESGKERFAKSHAESIKANRVIPTPLGPMTETFASGALYSGAQLADFLIPVESVVKATPRLANAGGNAIANHLSRSYLSFDDWSKALSSGLGEEVVETSVKLARETSTAIRQRNLVRAHGNIGRTARVGATEEYATASEVAKNAHGRNVARITEEYNDQLSRMDEMFPPDAARRGPGEVRVRPENQASFMELSPTLTDDLTVHPSGRIAPPPQPINQGGVPVRSGTPPHVVTERIPGRPGPINTRHETAGKVLTQAYERQLAEAELAYESVERLISKTHSRKMATIGPSSKWEELAKIEAKKRIGYYQQSFARSGEKSAREYAKRAIDRSYEQVVKREAVSLSDLGFAGRVAQDSAGVKLAPKVPKGKARYGGRPPAKHESASFGNGFWKWVRDRSQRMFVDPLRQGPAAALNEGKAFSAARTFRGKENAPVRDFLTDVLPRDYADTTGAVSRLKFKIEQGRRGLSSSVDRYAKASGQSVDDVYKLLNRARDAGDSSMVPAGKLRDSFEETGLFVDGMSQRMLQEGLLPNEAMAATVRHNLGRYLHRSYASVHSKDWAAAVRNTDKWETAFKWFKENYPHMTDDEVIGSMARMVERPRDYGIGKSAVKAAERISGDLPKPLADELIRRKDVPDELKELWGISDDFATNVDITAAKMIEHVEWGGFWRRAVDRGLENGTFSRVPSGDNIIRIPLGDLMPNEEIYAAEEVARLIGVTNDFIPKVRGWNIPFLNSMAKLGKTVGSPRAGMRNFESWPFMWLQAGVTSVRNPVMAAKSGKAALKFLRWKVTGSPVKFSKWEQEIIERAHRYGLIDSGVASGTTEIWSRQLAGSATGKKLSGLTPKRVGRALYNHGPRQAIEWYRGTDSVGKLYGFAVTHGQLDKLVTTAEDAAYLAGSKWYRSADTWEAAGNYTKATMQHFPDTPAVGRKLAKNPVAGTFVSFKVEMARTSTNRMRVIADDFQHGVAQIKRGNVKSGTAWIARATSGMAGFQASLLGWKAARAYQNQKLSIGPEMEQAFRRRAMAPWAKYNDFLFRDYDPKTGDVSIQDVGYSNPFGEITSLMEAAFFEPGTVGEKASRVAEQLEDVFLGKEIFLWAGLETAMNVQTEGSNVIEALTDAGTKRPITHEYQPDALMERMYYFFKKTGPGVFVEPERVFEEAGAGRFYGLLPEKDKTIDSTVMQEVLSIFGMPRVASYNIGDSLGYHYTDASFRKRALSYAVGKSIRAGRFEGDLPKFEEAWTEIQAQVHELVDDSWKLNQSGKSIQKHLREAGFNDALTKAMMHGQFVPLGAAINLESR